MLGDPLVLEGWLDDLPLSAPQPALTGQQPSPRARLACTRPMPLWQLAALSASTCLAWSGWLKKYSVGEGGTQQAVECAPGPDGGGLVHGVLGCPDRRDLSADDTAGGNHTGGSWAIARATGQRGCPGQHSREDGADTYGVGCRPKEGFADLIFNLGIRAGPRT